MCSKHVNGFPPHTITSQIKTKLEKKIYNYVFIFDDIIFVNSSITHRYETQILHVLCLSFFVMVKKTKPYKIICFLYVFLSFCFSIFVLFAIDACLPQYDYHQVSACELLMICVFFSTYIYTTNTLTLFIDQTTTTSTILTHTKHNIFCVLRLAAGAPVAL